MEQAARIVGVGIVGMAGLVLAARAQDGFWHYAGFGLALAAVWIAFRLIDRTFSPAHAAKPLVPVPARPARRLLAGALAVLLGLIGLFVAAGAGAGTAAYYIALGVTLVAWGYVFRLIGTS